MQTLASNASGKKGIEVLNHASAAGALRAADGMLQSPRNPTRIRTNSRPIEPIMTQSFDTIIVGGGAAGCVLANRLSAVSSRNVLLLEAGTDMLPGQEPADVLDTYATSYYNDAYFWPGLKVHWRRKDNSPLTGFSQGRVIGGGSSVMGMVAYRGSPDDYAEWEASGAKGWGWNDVLPFYRKLEHDMDFGGDQHGKDGPVPVRRISPKDWAPLSKAVHVYAQEHQIPFIADMNTDFRDGYGAVPMSNWPDKRASAAICYLDAAVRARKNLTIVSGAHATALKFDGKRATGVTVRIGGEQKEFSAREIILSMGGIHSPAFLLRMGIGPARHLREHGIEVRADLPGVGENLSNHAIVFVGLLQNRGARQPESLRPHPMTAFRYSSGLPGAPPLDMYINVQCKTSWSPLGFQVANLAPTLLKPMARGRVSLAGRRRAAAGRIQFHRPRPRPEALHAGLPPRRRRAGTREGARHEQRHLPGEVQRPAAAAQPHQHQEQGAERRHRQADRPRARRSPARSSRRSPTGASISLSSLKMTTHSPSTFARTSPARSIRSAPAA